MRKYLLISFVLALVLLVSCGGAKPLTPAPSVTTTPATPSPTASAPPVNAAALFTANCAGCHGASRLGVGSSFPALTPNSLSGETLDSLVNKITKGISGTAMPAFSGKLSTAEINALANLIKNVAP